MANSKPDEPGSRDPMRLARALMHWSVVGLLLAGATVLLMTSILLGWRRPIPELGRIFPERVKGVIVYLTAPERTFFHLANAITIGCFMVIVAVLFWDRWRKERRVF